MGTLVHMAMAFTECCGRKPRTITIDMSEAGALSLLVCDGCERQQWFRDGVPIDLDDVTAMAATRWNRKLGLSTAAEN